MVDTSEKQTENVYISPKAKNSTVVIDNGTYEFKAGYMGDLSLAVRNKIYKYKEKVSFEPFPSSSVKTMFDSDVIVHFDVLEHTMDAILEHLKPDELEDLIFTIAPHSPTEAELLDFLFSTYKFNKIQLGYDSVYCYHQYFDGKDCVVVDLKFSSITVLVIQDGRINDIYKINFGGKDLQEYINYIMVDKYKEARKDYRGLKSYIRVSDNYNKEALEIYGDMCNGVYERNIFLSDRKEQVMEREAKKAVKKEKQGNAMAAPSLDYSLMNSQDEGLDKEQLKEKKRLKMIFFGALARVKSKIEKTLSAFDEIIDNFNDEKEKMNNLEKYVSKKKARFSHIKRDLELRERLRRDARNKKSREFQVKFKEGQLTDEEQLIKQAILDAEDDLQENQLISQLNQLASEIVLLDPDFIPFYANTVEILRGDNIGRQCVNVELIKWPEIIFDPSIIGSDQMGLSEIFENIFPKAQIANVLLCGGFSFIQNLERRIKDEIRQHLFVEGLTVVRALDTQKDPFVGARFSDLLPVYLRKDYEDVGAEAMVARPH